LHRALDGDGPLPLEFVVGRICEEFHCLPSAAWREYLQLPAGLLETILEFRAYGRAKAIYDARGQRTHDPPLTDLVVEHDFAIVNERRRGRADV
jgi:hypothetical protein